MKTDICFTADDIANVYKTLNNEHLTLEELSKRFRAQAGINKLCATLDNFINKTSKVAVDRLIDYLQNQEPELYAAIKEIKGGIDLVKQIDDRVYEITKLTNKVEDIYNKFNDDVLAKVFSDMIKETVTVKNGMLELSYKARSIDNRYYFLNSDFILKTVPGEIILLDDLEYYYGRKFYTGELYHNGTISLTYFKLNDGS